MENRQISGYTDLLLRIEELKANRFRQEEEIKDAFADLRSSFNILSLLSGKTISKYAEPNFIKAGLNMGLNMLIAKVLGKNRSLKGFLSAVFLETIATIFINHNLTTITSFVDNLKNQFFKKNNPDSY
jgi:hypothetical protein